MSGGGKARVGSSASLSLGEVKRPLGVTAEGPGADPTSLML